MRQTPSLDSRIEVWGSYQLRDVFLETSDEGIGPAPQPNTATWPIIAYDKRESQWTIDKDLLAVHYEFH